MLDGTRSLNFKCVRTTKGLQPLNATEKGKTMTATNIDLATYASQNYLISIERAEGAVETYIGQIEALENRTIDRDAIEMDDEQFLRGVIDAAATTGDLYV